MFKTIEGAADSEIRSVIRFLKARNVLPSEIHHQICQVYGDNAMSVGMVRNNSATSPPPLKGNTGNLNIKLRRHI